MRQIHKNKKKNEKKENYFETKNESSKEKDEKKWIENRRDYVIEICAEIKSSVDNFNRWGLCEWWQWQYTHITDSRLLNATYI